MFSTIRLPRNNHLRQWDIVMACVVLLMCQRGGSGRAETDLKDEVVPCALENCEEDDGHDRNPALNAKSQRNYLKGWFNGTGAVARDIMSYFQGYPTIPKTFCQLLLKI